MLMKRKLCLAGLGPTQPFRDILRYRGFPVSGGQEEMTSCERSLKICPWSVSCPRQDNLARFMLSWLDLFQEV